MADEHCHPVTKKPQGLQPCTIVAISRRPAFAVAGPIPGWDSISCAVTFRHGAFGPTFVVNNAPATIDRLDPDLSPFHSLIDLKDGTCSEFMIFTDDLPAFQEYVQAHNAQEGEFTVDLQPGFFQR